MRFLGRVPRTDDEGSIPFTRSKSFQRLSHVLPLQFRLRFGCKVQTFAPFLFAARILRRPCNLATSALRTASISTGAYVLWSAFDRPIEFASLADNPTASVPPAIAS